MGKTWHSDRRGSVTTERRSWSEDHSGFNVHCIVKSPGEYRRNVVSPSGTNKESWAKDSSLCRFHNESCNNICPWPTAGKKIAENLLLTISQKCNLYCCLLYIMVYIRICVVKANSHTLEIMQQCDVRNLNIIILFPKPSTSPMWVEEHSRCWRNIRCGMLYRVYK